MLCACETIFCVSLIFYVTDFFFFAYLLFFLLHLVQQTSTKHILYTKWGFPGGSDSKESAFNAGDPGSIPGWGRSPGEGNGNPLQYSCLENSVDRGAWQATVHGVAKSWTQLSD